MILTGLTLFNSWKSYREKLSFLRKCSGHFGQRQKLEYEKKIKRSLNLVKALLCAQSNSVREVISEKGLVKVSSSIHCQESCILCLHPVRKDIILSSDLTDAHYYLKSASISYSAMKKYQLQSN